MAKYTMYEQRPKKNPAKQPPHPVWRGIGCALMIIIPIISFVIGDYLVTNAKLFKWVVIPREMLVAVYKDPLILVRILYTAIFIVVLYLLLTAATFIINRFFGPPRYGPQDIPLDKVERK
jgi:hypothetical protein